MYPCKRSLNAGEDQGNVNVCRGLDLRASAGALELTNGDLNGLASRLLSAMGVLTSPRLSADKRSVWKSCNRV
jgi:hypothetical protein